MPTKICEDCRGSGKRPACTRCEDCGKKEHKPGCSCTHHFCVECNQTSRQQHDDLPCRTCREPGVVNIDGTPLARVAVVPLD